MGFQPCSTLHSIVFMPKATQPLKHTVGSQRAIVILEYLPLQKENSNV